MNNYTAMDTKGSRLEVIRLILSSQEISSQEDLLKRLQQEGFLLSQATLSRDLKQLKVAKAASMNGRSIYILPNNAMYRRVREHRPIQEMLLSSGVQAIHFSGNLCVIKTRPGYASSVAYDIDNANIPEVIGTVAGDDTIMIVLEENYSRELMRMKLETTLNK
jgi:transcriptional regulator of arginine metabolism